jgi:hypothetical protein
MAVSALMDVNERDTADHDEEGAAWDETALLRCSAPSARATRGTRYLGRVVCPALNSSKELSIVLLATGSTSAVLAALSMVFAEWVDAKLFDDFAVDCIALSTLVPSAKPSGCNSHRPGPPLSLDPFANQQEL